MKRNLAFISLFLAALFSFGFQQQGRKSVSLDNEDLSSFVPPPPSKLVEVSPGEYSPAGGGYAIRLPKTPTSLAKKVSTIAGDVVLYYMTLNTDDLEYNIGYADYPPNLDMTEQERIYGAFRDGLLRETQAALISDKEIRLKDLVGREVVISKDGVKEANRLYLVDHRLYVISIDYSVKQDRSKEINQYFNSFKITDK